MVDFKKLLKEGKKTPLPHKEWDSIATRVKYPSPAMKYNISPKDVPIQDKTVDGRWILQTKQGRVFLWESTMIELAMLVQKNEYQKFDCYFKREGKTTHIEVVSESLVKDIDARV